MAETEIRELKSSADYQRIITELGYTEFEVDTHWREKPRRHWKIKVNGQPYLAALADIRSILSKRGIQFDPGWLRDTLVVMACKGVSQDDK